MSLFDQDICQLVKRWAAEEQGSRGAFLPTRGKASTKGETGQGR